MTVKEFETQVDNWIDKNGLITPGSHLLLGVSGGADSVALLRFFCSVRQKRKLELRVVHVEHGLRGQASLDDAAFVDKLCRQLGVECTTIHVGEQISSNEDTHQSLEEKARNARYEAFADVAQNWEEELGEKPVILALAQHRDDNVETLLFHLARGTGLDGLRGMPISREKLVRPFLHMSRTDIEAYLQELGQSYCTDATNDEVLYARNRLRHEVLPVLEQVNTQALSHMNETAFLLGEVADYINVQAAQILSGLTITSPRATVLSLLATAGLSAHPDFMVNEVIHLWLQRAMGGVKNITSSHILAVKALVDAQVGKMVHLPGGLAVVKAYKGLELRRSAREDESVTLEPIEVKIDDLTTGPAFINCQFGQFVFCVLTEFEPSSFPTNAYTKWLDCDKVKGSVWLRGRQSGDYFILDAEGHHKLLQDYFIDEKIPEEERDEIPLLCEQNHVLWIVGKRLSNGCFVGDGTAKVLEVTFIPSDLEEEK